MSSAKHQLRWMSAIAVLLVLALEVACTGFFQNPTLTSIAVGPATPTIETGSTNNTVQMTVVGTNNDGSTSTNPSVSWGITPTTVATISSSGLVTSVSTGTATITAAANANPSITGSQTLTVTVGCIESIVRSPTNNTISVGGADNTQTYTATANTCNGSIPFTDVATWTSSNTSIATVAGGTATAVAPGTTIINATEGNIVSNNATLNVTQ
ncbi:MAG: Ig-like domain-containing protein [Candidatus Sulfotelmatobacter sp.]